MQHRIGWYNWLRVRTQSVNLEDHHHLDSELSSSSEPEDYVDVFGTKDVAIQWPKDYWKIQKLIKYLKLGNPTLVVMALLCLSDCDFTNSMIVQALKDNNLINVMLNYLESDCERLQVIALRCLEKLSVLKNIRYEIVYFEGLNPIVQLLWQPSFMVRREAAYAIAKIAVFHRAWKIIRLLNGIQLLAELLYLPKHILSPTKPLNSEEQMQIDAAIAGATALKVICHDRKNTTALWYTGVLDACRRILNTDHINLLIAVIGLIQKCARHKFFLEDISRMRIFTQFKRCWYSSGTRALAQICAQTVFVCAENLQARNIIGQKGFIEKIFEILKLKQNHNDEELMVAMSGALWKCSKSLANVKRLNILNASPVLVQLLDSPFIDVRVNIVGCLGLCFRHTLSCEKILKVHGMQALFKQMKTTYPQLQINFSFAMAEASFNRECMHHIMESDTIRHVWSYMRTNNLETKSKVSWCLCPILRNMEDTAGFIRSMIGGIELLIKMIMSRNFRISSPACAILTIICEKMETLVVLTEYEIVKLLLKQARIARHIKLQYHLCLAVSVCCNLSKNLKEFRENGMVDYLLNFLTHSTELNVKGAACRALHQFSSCMSSCAIIYNTKNAIPLLIEVMNCDEFEVRKCAAEILQQIRLFSLYREGTLEKYLPDLTLDSKFPIV